MPFSLTLPTQNTSNTTTSSLAVPIVSQTELNNIAELYLPYSLFSENETYVLNVAPVPDTYLYDVNGTNIWGNASYASNLGSAVLSLTIDGTLHFFFCLI